MHKKYTIEQVKKISPSVLLKLIQKAKDFVKKTEAFTEMCEDFDVKPDIIDLIPVKFDDLEVSARTEKGIIILNYKLLCDGDFFKDYMYLCHEARHYLQQCYNEKPTRAATDDDYLDNKDEVDAFKTQVGYIDEIFGDDEAEKYVDHLTKYHGLKGSEKEEKEEELLEKVNED